MLRLLHVYSADKTSVFLDVRSFGEFADKSLLRAVSVPLDDVVSGKLAKIPLPEDDFNRRIILFGRDPAQARRFADLLSKRPWHNVSYYAGSTDELLKTLGTK